MKKIFGKRGCAGCCVLIAIVAAVGWYTLIRTEPTDTRFNGAYRLEDGRLVIITPREGEVLRYRMMDGRSSALWPVADAAFEAGPGWQEREPVELTLTFTRPPGGSGFTELRWRLGRAEPCSDDRSAGDRLHDPCR